MATISNTPRPGYAWDATDNVWYPIGTGPHTHADYITSSSAINPTIVDAKGDIIAATAADTVARLAVGANGTVLTAASGQATGLQWATPSSGGITLLSTTSLSGSSVTVSSIDQTYVNLIILMSGVNISTNTNFSCNINASLQTSVIGQGGINNTTTYSSTNSGAISLRGETDEMKSGNADSVFFLQIENYASTTANKTFMGRSRFLHPDSSVRILNYGGSILLPTTAITSLQFYLGGGTFSAGSILIYGVK